MKSENEKMNRQKQLRKRCLLTLLIVLLAISTAQTVHATDLELLNFSVSPENAKKGTTVTARVTVKNKDLENAKTINVIFKDEGWERYRKMDVNIPPNGQVIVEGKWTVDHDGPHCYCACTEPADPCTCYCESAPVPEFPLGAEAAVGIGLMVAIVYVWLRKRKTKPTVAKRFTTQTPNLDSC